MADGYIDLSPIIREIARVDRNVDAVNSRVQALYGEVVPAVRSLRGDMEQLKRDFVQMIEENRRQAALQRALTEIVRVRQELERNFGNYKAVRNTMMGILEATDSHLVQETVINNVSQELMLSAPRYWLAPVVVALSAWIANNKSLAYRALDEAIRRDDEKTSLTFALICRRAGKKDACFMWLSRYFAMQKAENMKESIIAYIDAYTNGVFGIDDQNRCEEYIQHWIAQLQRDNPNFAEEQVDYWKNLWASTYDKDEKKVYPDLALCCPEFTAMSEYAQRVESAPLIAQEFAKILSTEVDRQSLVTAIDNELIKLVTNYDTDEAPLREEEEFLTDIKNSNGDEKWARARQERRKAMRIDSKVDLAGRLNEAITSGGDSNVSAKKTAIRFMQGHIKTAFKEYVEEKAPAYPEEITLRVNDWEGKTTDGSNRQELVSSYNTEIETRRKNALANVKPTTFIVMLCLAAVGLILAIVGICLGMAESDDNANIAVILLALGFVLLLVGLIVGLITLFKYKKKRAKINQTHDMMADRGGAMLNNAITQRITLNDIVANFNAAESCEQILLTEGE